MGLAQLPEPMVAEGVRTGKLVQVLERFAPVAPGVFLYYPSRRQILPKLRAFIDHVKNRPAGPRHQLNQRAADRRSATDAPSRRQASPIQLATVAQRIDQQRKCR